MLVINETRERNMENEAVDKLIKKKKKLINELDPGKQVLWSRVKN